MGPCGTPLVTCHWFDVTPLTTIPTCEPVSHLRFTCNPLVILPHQESCAASGDTHDPSVREISLTRWGTFLWRLTWRQRWAQEVHRTEEHNRAQEKASAILGAGKGCSRTGSRPASILGCFLTAWGHAWVCRERPRESTEYRWTELVMPFGGWQAEAVPLKASVGIFYL